MVKIEEVTVIDAPAERCFDLARSVEVHLLGNVHNGEQAVAMGGAVTGLLGRGDLVTWQARHFGLRYRLTSQIMAYHRPVYFQDAMRQGPFRSMTHDHFFRRLPDGRTEMKDIFSFAAPVPVAGPVVEKLVLRRYMRELLRERNRVIREVAESEEWRRYVEA